MPIHIQTPHGDGALIYHVPKCGGNWVRAALRAWGVEFHEWFAEGASVEHSVPAHFPGFQGPSCVFVREPVDWLRSWWRIP